MFQSETIDRNSSIDSLSHQGEQDRLLNVEAIFCLLEDDGACRIDHSIGDLFAPMSGKTMHENGIRFCMCKEFLVDLIWEEDLLAPP